MTPRLFLPYYSKSRGPPRLRFQVMGKRGKKFHVLVVANQRDPRDGKHMEVLGTLQRRPVNPIPSAIGEPHDSLCEIRLRFSRIKYWLGVGCDMGIPVQLALSHANLIPPPPPKFGERTKGHYHLLSQIADKHAKIHLNQVKAFLQSDSNIQFEPSEEQYTPNIDETPARTILSKLYPRELRDQIEQTNSATRSNADAVTGSGKIIRKIVR